MINITEKQKCCGCTACISVCPQKCISMSADKEGFLYPVVDSGKCVDCCLCEKVCPVLNPVRNESEPLVYAAINNDETVRMQSSSGGMFTLIAESVIDRGGVVFGVCFDREWNVVHDYTETKEELAKFRGSKYVQSNVGNCFTQVKTFLDSGREVLFSGTPCQVAGLKNYLRKPYSNLLTVDLVCHGVPSPYVWRKYLQETVCRAYGIKGDNKYTVNPGDYISDISFRAKDNGWKKYSFRILYRDGRIEIRTFSENIYMNVFLSNLSLRPSCYACPTKLGNAQSDITLADFWGVDKMYPSVDDDRGCGLIFIHSKEKFYFLYKMDCKLLQQQLDCVVKYNPSILYAANEPVNRKFFWSICYRNDFKLSHKVVFSNFILMRIIRKVYRYL